MGRYMRLITLVGFALIFYLFFAYQASSQLPRYDEIWYLESVQTINTYGVPLFYWGEDTTYKYDETSPEGLVSGLVHPPLYPYALTLFYNLFGQSIWSLRFFGIVMNLLTLMILFFLSKTIYSEKKGKRVWYFTAILLLVNPAFITQSMNLGIDTGIYSLFIALFFLCSFMPLSHRIKIPVLGTILALALLCKYTTIFFVLAAFAFYFILKKEWKKLLTFLLPITLIGITMWITLFSLYLLYFEGSWWFVLQFTLLSRIIQAPLTFLGSLMHLLKSLVYTPFIVTLPFFMTCFMSLIWRVKKYMHDKIIHQSDCILLFALLSFFAYSLKAPNFFYMFPLLFYWTYMVGIFFEEHIPTNQALFFILLIPLVIIYGLLMFDPQLLLNNILPWSTSSVFIILKLSWYAGVGIIISLLGFFIASFKNYRYQILCIVILGVAMGVTIQQSRAEYSTITIYGEEGYDETIMYMEKIVANDKIRENEVIISRWDIGYLMGQPFYSDDEFTTRNLCGIDNKLTQRSLGTCGILNVTYHTNQKEILQYDNLTYIIHSNYFQELDRGLAPDLLPIIYEQYMEIAHFGNFVIYEKKEQ